MLKKLIKFWIRPLRFNRFDHPKCRCKPFTLACYSLDKRLKSVDICYQRDWDRKTYLFRILFLRFLYVFALVAVFTSFPSNLVFGYLASCSVVGAIIFGSKKEIP